MHGLGNDFAVFDARKQTLTLAPAAARSLADRRRGIGCDQIIVIGEGRDGADAVMRIVNADSSEVETCGNAARCVATLLMAESGRDDVTLATLAGPLACRRTEGGLIAVDMGKPRLGWSEIPLAHPVADTTRFELDDAAGPHMIAAAVSMGNPHCVLFVDDAETADIAGIGSRLEIHPMFPRRTNVEFVSVAGANRLRMRVWERGAGITMACGSGACASFVAAHRRGLVGPRAAVMLDGGTLELSFTATGGVTMTGPAALTFRGEIDLDGFGA
jgi:diaminopimelate epimerase